MINKGFVKGLVVAGVLCLAAAWSAGAKIVGLSIDRHGEFFLVVEVESGTFVTVTQWGELIDIEAPGEITYHSSIFDHLDGRVKRAGGAEFDYYDSIFAYLHGKVKRIGGITFDYWDDFDASREGKLKTVGGERIEYYDVFTLDDSKKGFPKKIAGLPVDFYGERDFGPGSDERAVGLLKSVGPKRFSYGHRQRGRDPQMNGPRDFNAGGIRVRVRDDLYRGRRKY